MVRLLVNSDDIATLTSDSATPDKVDLLLFFNNAFASKVKTICESNPPKNTFELYIMTTSGLTIQDVTNDLKLFVNGVASLNDTSRIPLSISGLTLATTGFVEFHVAYDTNYEIYSNSLSIKSCTIPEAPVLIDELTIGLPDGAQV